MDQDLISSIEKAIEANAKFSKDVADGVHGVFEALKTRQRAFEEKKKSIREEIDSGSRRTKHRITL
jgi:gas vesicle protein